MIFYSLMEPLFNQLLPGKLVVLDSLSAILVLVSGQINLCCDSYETCMRVALIFTD